MARPYSLDLRERVVAAVVTGESCRKVAETYRISVASVVKWSQRFRSTGSAPPSGWAATSLARWRVSAIGCWPALPQRRT
jgi:transposase